LRRILAIAYFVPREKRGNFSTETKRMNIAVTSQNRTTVTGHAGKCRKFWVFSVEDKQIRDKTLLELPIEQSFHQSSPQEPHPLDGVAAVITAGMGQGLVARLTAKGIKPVITTEENPEQAVVQWLSTVAPD
jgi:predicted Fe-Mo cluster-binding NifX family protein